MKLEKNYQFFMTSILESIKKYIMMQRSCQCIWRQRFLTNMEQSNDYLQVIGKISKTKGIGGDIQRECQAYVVALKVLIKEKILAK